MDNEGLALLASLLVGLAVFTATHVHAWDALHHADAGASEISARPLAVRHADPR